MVFSLIYGQKYAQTKVGTIIFDTIVSEEHVFNSRVTNYPVESGATYSDHIINDPDQVNISGIVTDSPLNIFAVFNRSIDAFNQLIELHRKRTILTLVTGIKVYTSMAITNLSIPRTIDTGQSLQFNMSFQRVFYDATMQTLEYPDSYFSGYHEQIPRLQVADNLKYPIHQNDPINILKDQASTAISAGVQSLENPSPAILDSINSNPYVNFLRQNGVPI